jgi:hypothetical protein
VILEIENARTTDDLYTARMNLKRVNMPADPGVDDLILWQKAYYSLSLGFRNRNHFRNGVIAFYRYLDLKEQYLKIIKQNSIDSIIAVNSRVKNSEARQIQQLSGELNELNSNRAEVVELRRTYSLWGTIISVLIVLVFTYLIFVRHRRINSLRKGLSDNREHIMHSSDKLIESSLLKASRRMMVSVSVSTADFIGDMMSEGKLNSDDEQALQQIRKELKEL